MNEDPPPSAPAPMTPLGEPLVSADAVAAFLSIDTATVYRLARNATLPAIQVAPRVLRFRPEDVRAYLERRTRRAPPRGRVNRLLEPSA